MKHLSLVFAFFMLGCSGSQELASRWHGGEPEGSHGLYFPDQKVSIDVQNDAEYLYLAVDFGERGRQVLFQGLTVWLDREGGTERRLGIRYPVGMGRERVAGEEDPAEGSPDLASSVPPELEIIGPGTDQSQRMNFTEAGGITASVDERDGTLRYRGRIPLADSGAHRYAIGTRPGGVIGLGIEVAGRAGRPEGGRRERPAGERGGMGRRGDYGTRPRGTGRPEPLEIWTKVLLAGVPR